jgi:hypothetical protein
LLMQSIIRGHIGLANSVSSALTIHRDRR